MKNLTQETLKHYLIYDLETGIFSWRNATSRRVKEGSKAGVLVSDGYIRIRLLKKLYLAHRLAWLYVFGKFPSLQIDHINRNKSDNRIENLRESTVIQNAMNVGLCSRNTSGFRGVCWKASANKWVARCTLNGKTKTIGHFDSANDAAIAHKEYTKAKYGEFFPQRIKSIFESTIDD